MSIETYNAYTFSFLSILAQLEQTLLDRWSTMLEIGGKITGLDLTEIKFGLKTLTYSQIIENGIT